MPEELLAVEDLEKHFPITRGIVFQKEVGRVRAVDGVSFRVNKGETLGVVGESGCGKSTMARCVMRLLEPTGGSVTFDGEDITRVRGGRLMEIRRKMQMVFQDPYASLNTRKRVGSIIGEALEVHKAGTSAEIRTRVRELLDVVGLNPEHYNRFPHEFSGGQRQRIGIARALAIRPKLIVCDEPVSALDVSVQAQVLNLLKQLQREFDLTYVFIAHDLDVVKHISNRVAVMYLGKIVEMGSGQDLYKRPLHPYSGALLSAVPIPNPELARKRVPVVLEGDVPSPINPPSACRFHPRCPRFQAGTCDQIEPPLEDKQQGHLAACHFPLESWPLTDLRLPREATPV
jgi:oligopeptide/dipeptide ABC transporter ATP-binding protein